MAMIATRSEGNIKKFEPGRRFTLSEVKILCVEAAIWAMKHHGDKNININDFFKQKGL